MRVNGYHPLKCLSRIFYSEEKKKMFGNSQDVLKQNFGSTNLRQSNVKCLATLRLEINRRAQKFQ